MRTILIALAIAAIAAPGAAKDRNLLPEATPTGKPESCIDIGRIRASHVRNDWVIDFEMTNRKVYRNTMPNSCPGLQFQDKFAYKVSNSQLCAVDTITVLQPGGSTGPTCGLGEFQPVKLAGKP